MGQLDALPATFINAWFEETSTNEDDASLLRISSSNRYSYDARGDHKLIMTAPSPLPSPPSSNDQPSIIDSSSFHATVGITREEACQV